MTKAAELAKMGEVLTNSQIGGRRNIIINGAMQVAQRSTSETGLGATSGYHTIDRMRMNLTTSGRFTMSQSTDTPDGFSKSLKIDCTTADTSIAADEQIRLNTRIEGQDLQQLKKGTSDAEYVTLSFYAKIVGSATDFVVELQDTDNTRQISKLFTFTTSWQRYYFIVPGDTTGAFTDDNNNSLNINFWLHAGSNHTSGTLSTTWTASNNPDRAAGIDSIVSSTSNEWYMTGLQMEVGSQATPFEHRSFGEELNLCMRYFKKIEVGNNIRISTSAIADTTSRARFVIYHNPEMRSTPTAAETNLDLAGTDINAIATTGSTDLNDVIITRGSGSHSTGDILDVHQGSNTATLDFASEL